jgi:hypothetical protein
MDAYQAMQALSLRGVGVGHNGGDTLTVDAPAELMTDELRSWFREAKRPFLTYFKTGRRLLVKPPPLEVISAPTEATEGFREALAPPEPPPPPPASIPAEWTDPSIHPGFWDAFDRAIPAEEASEILAFDREMRAAGRKPSPRTQTPAEV